MKSQLRATGSLSVTCHPTQVNAPLNELFCTALIERLKPHHLHQVQPWYHECWEWVRHVSDSGPHQPHGTKRSYDDNRCRRMDTGRYVPSGMRSSHSHTWTGNSNHQPQFHQWSPHNAIATSLQQVGDFPIVSPQQVHIIHNTSVTSWHQQKSVVSVVSCHFPNSITTTCCQLVTDLFAVSLTSQQQFHN